MHKEWLLRRHEQTCTGDKNKHTYPGGVYRPTPSAVELLDMNSIQVDTSFVFPYRATFDFEVLLENTDLPQPKTSDPKTQYTVKQLSMSVSVCSNVPSFEDTVCFISDGDPQSLVNKMVDYLEEVSDHAYHLLREEFADVFDQLDEKEDEEEKEEDKQKQTKTKKQKNKKKRLQHGPYTTMDRSYGQDLATATGGLSSSTTCNWFQQRQIRSQR